MKKILAYALFALVCIALHPLFAQTPEPVQICPTATPGSLWNTCAKWTCAVPTSNDDLVQSQVAGSKLWVKLATVPMSGTLARCAPVNNNWFATRSSLGIGVIAPPVVLYPWLIEWNPPTTNVDGSPLTDLKSFRVENSGAIDGPWVAVATAPVGMNNATANLPSSVKQCFRVISIAINEGAPSDVYCAEPVARTPGKATNVKAAAGNSPLPP